MEAQTPDGRSAETSRDGRGVRGVSSLRRADGTGERQPEHPERTARLPGQPGQPGRDSATAGPGRFAAEDAVGDRQRGCRTSRAGARDRRAGSSATKTSGSARAEAGSSGSGKAAGGRGESAARQARRSGNEKGSGRSVSILVAEDNPALRDYLHAALQGRYDVITASNGQEALSLAVEQQPDLVLTDIVMPGMTGIELCRRLKTEPQTAQIAVILLTAQQSSGLRNLRLQSRRRRLHRQTLLPGGALLTDRQPRGPAGG